MLGNSRESWPGSVARAPNSPGDPAKCPARGVVHWAPLQVSSPPSGTQSTGAHLSAIFLDCPFLPSHHLVPCTQLSRCPPVCEALPLTHGL